MKKNKTPFKKVFVSVILLALGLAAGYGVLAFFLEQRPHPASSGVPLVPEPLDASQVVIFFSKARGSQNVVEGVIRRVPGEMQPLIVDFAVEQLLKGPSEQEVRQGYFSEIPRGTMLLGISHRDRQLRINLSRHFVSGGGSNSMQQRLEELTGTIRSVEKELPVYVDIEGRQLNVLGGEGVMVDEPVNRRTGT